MKKSEITAFAKKNGYDGVVSLGKWREYDAYEPVFNKSSEEEPAFIGPPLLVLVKGEEIRMSTVDEAYAQLDESGDDDAEDDQ